MKKADIERQKQRAHVSASDCLFLLCIFYDRHFSLIFNLLNKANVSSEVSALIQCNALDEETGKSVLLREGIADDKIESVFDRFEAMRSV